MSKKSEREGEGGREREREKQTDREMHVCVRALVRVLVYECERVSML